MALKLITFPLFYFIQFSIVWHLAGILWATFYILSVPLVGFLSLKLWYFIKMTYYKCQFNRKFDTKQMQEALSIRAELKSFIQTYLDEIQTRQNA
jgi:hypothetical protein